MHTVLAFMTLEKQFTGNDGGKEYILLKYTRMHRDNQRVCEEMSGAAGFCACRVIQTAVTLNAH